MQLDCRDGLESTMPAAMLRYSGSYSDQVMSAQFPRRSPTPLAVQQAQAQRKAHSSLQGRSHTSPGSSSGISWSGRMPGLVSFASVSVALRGATALTQQLGVRKSYNTESCLL